MDVSPHIALRCSPISIIWHMHAVGPRIFVRQLQLMSAWCLWNRGSLPPHWPHGSSDHFPVSVWTLSIFFCADDGSCVRPEDCPCCMGAEHGVYEGCYPPRTVLSMNCKNWCVAFTESIDNSGVASRLKSAIIIITMASVGIFPKKEKAMKKINAWSRYM